MKICISIHLYNDKTVKYIGYKTYNIKKINEEDIINLRNIYDRVEYFVDGKELWIDIYVKNDELYGNLYRLNKEMLIDILYNTIEKHFNISIKRL